MRVAERETKQVPCAVFQKFRLKKKINIASTAKSVSPTSKIRPSAEREQDCVYCLCEVMWDPNQAEVIFFVQFFQLL